MPLWVLLQDAMLSVKILIREILSFFSEVVQVVMVSVVLQVLQRHILQSLLMYVEQKFRKVMHLQRERFSVFSEEKK